MKLINILISLCVIVPALAISPIEQRPSGHINQRNHFIKKRSITAGPETTTTTSTTTATPQYKPTRDELQIIVDCYYQRQWQRTNEALNSTEQFCERLATNQPNFTETTSRVFPTFRQVWDMLLQVNNTDNYTTNPEVIQDIENCYFSRTWESKRLSQLTFADLFCKRLAKDTPNREESGWMKMFKAHRQVWLSMSDVARTDYEQMQACFPKRSQSAACELFYERIGTPKTARDLSLKALKDCKYPAKQQSMDMVVWTYKSPSKCADSTIQLLDRLYRLVSLG